MPVLTTQQRNTLESAVKLARKLAETGARNALQALAVNNPEPFAHMSPEQRTLRNRLRNKARLLGDELPATGHQQIDHLSYELAYENWHKMLFAKFLEANVLLMHTSGVAVTMEECEELAKEEGFADKWEAAAAYASKMLPAIFRPEDPVMQVYFASNDRIKLEEVLDGLDNYIFTADDALGWVYQFWQSEAKKAINDSQAKIDGAKLPAVTQLFTEPYMVHFLIDNTIGAWWVSRYPKETSPLKFEYLRLLEDGTPAAGNFEGWPNTTKEITSLDPCMGSGHFVACLFPVFAKLRMYEEGLSKEEATDKVIKENLHGLELDARCTQIAAFNLALTAWKFIGYYKELPEMNLACSGIAPKGKREDWVKLVGKIADPAQKAKMENGMKVLYDHFQLAPELGSLLDPSTIKADMYTASFEELEPLLSKALENEADNDQFERGVMAAGIAKAGLLLSSKYHLLITNFPYLGRGKQKENGILFNHSSLHFPLSKSDLSTVFLEKAMTNLFKGGTNAAVMPQNWLYQVTYENLRIRTLKEFSLNFCVRLGEGGFTSKDAAGAFPCLLIISNEYPLNALSFSFLDAIKQKGSEEKNLYLRSGVMTRIGQSKQLLNPNAKILGEDVDTSSEYLSKYANSFQGIMPADRMRLVRLFWELGELDSSWNFMQGSSLIPSTFSGLEQVFQFEFFRKNLKAIGGRLQGNKAWDRKGISITQMRNIPTNYYLGSLFDGNIDVVVPKSDQDLPAIWNFLTSDSYTAELRKIDPKLDVNTASLIQVPFDMQYWEKVAKEKHPNGLPKPYTDDATQWIFHGHPAKANNPLQVALARLLGYRWPAESDAEMELAEEAREMIQQIKAFDGLTDEDGILCIPPVNGELAASEKLRSYLQAIYGDEWSNNTISQLLQKEGATASNLEDWLRTSFFEQHCKLFQSRPFIWHIWDGRKDGFSALVNYHKLDKETLQRLIFTYLGDWIRQCEAKRKSGESGAEGLLSAALKLKEKLEAILEGEAPYDIFVRWKPLEQQPIGWEPDLNDGVRMNIRPFITTDVLRKKPNIKWGVDRGKNPPGSYWGEIRDNDKHLSLEEKRKAR
jgi:hypothetical protein